MMAQPPHYHQAYADPNVVLTPLSDLTVAELFESISAIRVKPHARVTHACDHCRRLKTKCSGQQPVCASCQKRGRVCQWTPLKASKCRRSSRKPYDAWIPYHPPIAPKAPEHSYIVTPRPAAYPNVVLPRPIDGAGISVAQAASMATAPMVETMVQQSFAICSTHTQYDWEDLVIDPLCLTYPPSSSRSDSSSCEPVPPPTQRTPQETPTSVGPSSSPVEGVSQELPSDSDIEALFRELYQRVSSLSSDEFETFFTQ